MLLVLTGVTVISVALLAYVNQLTAEPIRQANAKTLNNALKEVLPEYTNDPVSECDSVKSEAGEVEFIIYPANNNGNYVGSAVQASSMGFGGELKVLVGFDAEGKIFNYSVLAHSETPGLGSKAADWFKAGNKGSIVGMNPGEGALVVSKDGGKVNAITASTITSRAFLQAVNNAYTAYKNNKSKDAQSAANKQEIKKENVEPADTNSEK